ncbi:MAG: 30S ribosomal protein S12 methylthiotransferase RimO [Zoogloeaceae bacterium]|jgi:ribosomal protein S12 methylthiotransferase|nr:30S ribosomal protein S12 methylthiotransferase RimO [Zoogloeaceae bacterium]
MSAVGFVSLGCPKNGSDSEKLLTRLRAEGFAIAPDYASADLVIVNTCGFIEAAVDESLEAIGEALAETGKVIVTGCLGAKADLIRQKHPKVLAVTAAGEFEAVLSAVHAHLPPPAAAQAVPEAGLRLTPPHFAYLKIAEGCNHECRFCIIPQLRGKLVSRPANEILQEAEALARSGVRELLVIAQDTAAYGLDLRYRTTFWGGRPVKSRIVELCEALSSLGLWLRLHYLYPYPIIDALLPLMAEGKVLPYLDVPMQHASPAILSAMRRPAAAENMLKRIEGWRAICPDLTIRSTFITGFPGETEADFQQLLDFLDAAQLDRVGAFAYSPVEGAAANALPGLPPEEVREERRERLMEHQVAISEARLAAKIGQTLTVLVDAVDDEGTLARSTGDAPEVDGLVLLDGFYDARPGDFLTAKIIDADAHDLYAEAV